MIAAANKSAYDQRLQYVQPSPPPSQSTSDHPPSPNPEQSPLTLLVKACSNLDHLTQNPRKRLCLPHEPNQGDNLSETCSPLVKRQRQEENYPTNFMEQGPTGTTPVCNQEMPVSSATKNFNFATYPKNNVINACSNPILPNNRTPRVRQNLEAQEAYHHAEHTKFTAAYRKAFEEQAFLRHQHFQFAKEASGSKLLYKCPTDVCTASCCQQELGRKKAKVDPQGIGSPCNPVVPFYCGWPNHMACGNLQQPPSYHNPMVPYPIYSPFLVPASPMAAPSAPYLPFGALVRPPPPTVLPPMVPNQCCNTDGNDIKAVPMYHPTPYWPHQDPAYYGSSAGTASQYPSASDNPAGSQNTEGSHQHYYNVSMVPVATTPAAWGGAHNNQPPNKYGASAGQCSLNPCEYPLAKMGKVGNHRDGNPKQVVEQLVTPYDAPKQAPEGASVSTPSWYMSAEASRLYYDYYYKLMMYNKSQYIPIGIPNPYALHHTYQHPRMFSREEAASFVTDQDLNGATSGTREDHNAFSAMNTSRNLTGPAPSAMGDYDERCQRGGPYNSACSE